ncbi:hypothetical protein SacmaDRAFT_0971 [Saccharomonospora marina XMU15]|uniref:Uncharacterized protein n=1 Tax=Saccharomonospora marina XMU15 TaxID=882083 RepID=H5XA99_9PSEU|nr:hypothetical protein [Saccharomonospora marina]EHR49264.1 hypothetical protein SacmaDRAFT_0971 [Saccharomonospora marina XMU15]
MRGTDTVERDVTGLPERPTSGRARFRWWRALTGSLAAGLALLALAVLAAEVFGWASGGKGPGAPAVAGHAVGAVLALVAQAVADRSRGRTAALAGLAVVALVAAVLWLFWWA